MTALRAILDWFAGGPDGYMTLVHCMNHDWFWIGLTVLLNLSVASGYMVIALHWRRNERSLPASPAKRALASMKQIFLFCGLCGYLFIPIKMFWPAWRLYDAFLAVLAYSTWRYAWGAKHLKVVYNELGRSEQLRLDLEESRAEGKRKGRFLNAIGHDLRTPLNGLLLQAELAELSLSASDTAGAQEAITEIKKCARTTANLLASFLEIGRLDWAENEPVWAEFDLAESVRSVVEKVHGQAVTKGLNVIRAGESGVLIRSDRAKLERILANLLDNAIKYTEKGDVGLRWELQGRDVVVHVTDTGVGIVAEHREQIFDDFFQVKNRERDSTKGFGLGLPIARRLARQLGGEIRVESEPGQGSRFSLRLPDAVVAKRDGGPGVERPRAGQPSTATTAPR